MGPVTRGPHATLTSPTRGLGRPTLCPQIALVGWRSRLARAYNRDWQHMIGNEVVGRSRCLYTPSPLQPNRFPAAAAHSCLQTRDLFARESSQRRLAPGIPLLCVQARREASAAGVGSAGGLSQAVTARDFYKALPSASCKRQHAPLTAPLTATACAPMAQAAPRRRARGAAPARAARPGGQSCSTRGY